MAPPEFSERNYEFFCNQELIGGHPAFDELGPFDLPWIPSQQQEGDLGFDVAFGDWLREGTMKVEVGALFLQYKVSHFLERNGRTAEDVPDSFFPYYRFNFRSPDSQFEALMELVDQGLPAYYVAPRFHREEHLIELAGQGLVVQESEQFSVNEIENGAEPTHDRILYHLLPGGAGRKEMYCCSEPQAADLSSFENLQDLTRHALSRYRESLIMPELKERLWTSLRERATNEQGWWIGEYLGDPELAESPEQTRSWLFRYTVAERLLSGTQVAYTFSRINDELTL